MWVGVVGPDMHATEEIKNKEQHFQKTNRRYTPSILGLIFKEKKSADPSKR
jgi:hypothetical protein